MFMYTCKDKEVDQGYKIIAVRLGSHTIIWRLFGPVDGRVIKPESITCDPEGNVYINDRGNSRILKISGLTGEVLRILICEEENMKILSMLWSKRQPNLTLRMKNQIITYITGNCRYTGVNGV